jgi:TolB protein
MLRNVAHTISDYIYERVTNEKGYFNTKLVYVETANELSSKRKTRLVQIDQDGFGSQELTDGSELISTPRYSPDGKSIAYIAYNENAKQNDIFGKSAQVYIMDLKSRSRKHMINKALMQQLIKRNNGNPVQMTYAPRFSKDNMKAVLAIIIKGKSAIYTIDLTDNKLTQLTEHRCIDTSPCFSPDGNEIVFTSNRDGKEAIFIMNSDGSNQRKISSSQGKYSQPIWSPRGDLIVFTKQVHQQFYIGIMKLDGSGEHLITSGNLVEAPSWCRNGRYIAFTRKSASGKLIICVMDVTGQHSRSIETKKDAAYADWSPK